MNRPWCHNCKCHNLGMSTNLFHVTSRFISALLGIAMSAPVWNFLKIKIKRYPTDQNKFGNLNLIFIQTFRIDGKNKHLVLT